MSKKRDDDLRDVLRIERGRGKKQRVDIEAERKFREDKERIRRIYETGTENDLRTVLREWKFTEERIEELITVFRAVRGV